MAADFTTTVVGLQETVAHLRKYEPDVLKKLQKDMKGRLKPLATAVGSAFPDYPKTQNGMNWRSGNGYSDSGQTVSRAKHKKGHFPLWDGLAKSRVIISSSTGKNSFARVVEMSPSGSVFDSAKKSKTKGFINALDYVSHSGTKSGGKSRSRVMLPKTKQNYPMIEKEVAIVVEKLNQEITKVLGGY